MRMMPAFEEESEGLPLAPLIDIVFLTLVFFMVTTTYSSLETELDIVLPTAETASEVARAQGEIVINLRADGSIVVNQRTLEIDALQDVLKRISSHFPEGSVIIHGDTTAQLGRALAIVDACRQANIANISFATGRLEPADAQE